MQKSVVLPEQELPALFSHSAESFHLGWKKKKKSSGTKSWNLIYIFAFWKRVLRPTVDLQGRACNWMWEWKWSAVTLAMKNVEPVLSVSTNDKWEAVIEDASLIHRDWFNRAGRVGQFHRRKKKWKNYICYHICAGWLNASWSNHGAPFPKRSTVLCWLMRLHSILTRSYVDSASHWETKRKEKIQNRNLSPPHSSAALKSALVANFTSLKTLTRFPPQGDIQERVYSSHGREVIN